MQFKRSVLENPCKILYMKHKSKMMRRSSRVGSPRSLSRMRYRWFRTAGMNLVNLLCTDSIFSTRYLWWGSRLVSSIQAVFKTNIHAECLYKDGFVFRSK